MNVSEIICSLRIQTYKMFVNKAVLKTILFFTCVILNSVLFSFVEGQTGKEEGEKLEK